MVALLIVIAFANPEGFSPEEEPPPEKLYLDPLKVRLWAGIAAVAVVIFLLWFVPTYQGWGPHSRRPRRGRGTPYSCRREVAFSSSSSGMGVACFLMRKSHVINNLGLTRKRTNDTLSIAEGNKLDFGGRSVCPRRS